MCKRTLAVILGIFFITNIGYAEVISLKHLENKNIGFFSRIKDHATLTFQPPPKAMGGQRRVSVTYYGVPEWNVNKELNSSLLAQLNSRIHADIYDLTEYKEKINTGFYIEGYEIGPKYIAHLSTLPAIKRLDYLLILFPSPRLTADFANQPLIPLIFYSATGIGQKVMTYGFNSGYRGGITSFISISFVLVDLKKHATVLYDDVTITEGYGYIQKISDAKKKRIYKFIESNISEQSYLDEAKTIIFNSQLLENDRNKLRNILKEDFDGEYDDDLEYALQDLDIHLVTNILTTTDFAKKIIENGAPDFDKQLEKLQAAVAKEIVEKIISD